MFFFPSKKWRTEETFKKSVAPLKEAALIPELHERKTQGQFVSMSVTGGQVTWVVTQGPMLGLTLCHRFEILNL